MTQVAHRRLRRLGLFLGLPLLLLLVGIVFVASKLGSDEEVMSDIDRHFAALEKGSSSARAYYDEKKYVGSKTDGDPARVEPLEEESPPHQGPKDSPDIGRRPRKRVARNEPAKPAPSPTAGPWPGIQQIAPGTYVIEEDLVNSARKSPKKFTKGIRAKLAEKDGQPVGFKLKGVRHKGAIYAAGLRSGDVLTAVNGFKLRTIDEAILAATALRFDDRFRVDILRSGRKQSFYYRMVSE